MQAQRIITQTDSTGHLTGLPLLPPGKSVEVILLLLDNQPSPKQQKAPARLKGKIREVGNIFSSAPADDWGIA
jgi:predicted metal-dependent RNase